MRKPFFKWPLRVFLTILFLLLFIHPDINFGTKSFFKPDILTVDEEAQLAELFLKEKREQLDSIMNVSATSFGFNGNVLLALNGHIVYCHSFGYADFSSRKPLNKNSPFQLASLSKQFTAMAIILLKENGKLNYDDPVQLYIDDFPYEDITIRHLLNHTSGLPNYLWFFEQYWPNDTIIPYNSDLIRIINEQKLPLNFKPGTHFDYSNTGYAVLAFIAEKISGERFGDLLEKSVFQPLGMFNTFVYSRAISKDYPIKVAGHNRSYRSFRPIEETLLDGIVGDKGVYSTTIDLLAWDQALYTERLVSRATLEEAYSPTKLANGREMPYGFGFRLKNENNKRVIYHHGRWEGFRNVFERYIDDKYTIILLNHTSFNGISRLSDHLIQSLFEPAYNSLTEDIVMAALHNGVKSAMKEYHDRKIKDPAINVDLVKVLEAVNYLDELNKHNLARKIKQLYFAISDDVQSSSSGS